ncbi:MAG: hypothetical protein GW949_04235 [Spirochaetales bacterium]|nr:hypothetical protein [Spirochaetales bacterium]
MGGKLVLLVVVIVAAGPGILYISEEEYALGVSIIWFSGKVGHCTAMT